MQDYTTFSEEHRHIPDSDHSYSERSLMQDGSQLPTVTAPWCYSGLTEEHKTELSSSYRKAPQAASQKMEWDDDREWPLPGATLRKRKKNPLTPEDAGASKPIPQLTQTGGTPVHWKKGG